MIIEALKDYTPEQIQAAKENTQGRGYEPDWMQELFASIRRGELKYSHGEGSWTLGCCYSGGHSHRLHHDAESPKPQPDTTIELSDAPVVIVRCTGDNEYTVDIPDDPRIKRVEVITAYPPLPEEPVIDERYTTEDGGKVECVASDEEGSCSLGGIPECVFYDTDCEGKRCEGIHCEIPQRGYITIADADEWHAGQADPVIQAAAELSAAIEEHEERRETQPGEWEECEVKYINGLPYVTMPAWHTDRRSRKTPTMYAAQWLDGFGGVQLEGQASKQEWYHGPVFLDECSNPIWTASEPEHKPARVTKSRFMRPNAAEE